jgi:dihydrofolate reductase
MAIGWVFIAASLDGYIARLDGDISWLMERNDPKENYGYDDFMANIDVIVMGSGSYNAIKHTTPWPYDRPVIVLSQSLSSADLLAQHGQVSISRESPGQLTERLVLEGCKGIYVDGGLVVQSFLRLGLISEIIITCIPVLLGQGRALFGPLDADITLVHRRTRTFPPGFVQSHYSVLGGGEHRARPDGNRGHARA